MGFGSYGGEVLGGRLAISAWLPSYAKASEGATSLVSCAHWREVAERAGFEPAVRV